jgi:hypothetical protein
VHTTRIAHATPPSAHRASHLFQQPGPCRPVGMPMFDARVDYLIQGASGVVAVSRCQLLQLCASVTRTDHIISCRACPSAHPIVLGVVFHGRVRKDAGQGTYHIKTWLATLVGALHGPAKWT